MIVHQLSNADKIKIKNKLKSLFLKYEEVVFVYIHGSIISANWFRDIDIGIFVDERRVSREEVLDYEIALSIELEKELHLPIEVKVLNYAPLSFKYEVTKGEVILSRDEETRYAFLEETWHSYLDYAPIEIEFIKALLQR
ncbi:MAG: nucleotidyltransferase domain-containing protein [Candidatus Methanoperedens sp.]|nr:nucleotidyltransferase domain-containing protein [Candidatus Methanoperedens sp.]